MFKGEKSSVKDKIKRPASIEREMVIDKERDIKRQTKDIVKVEHVFLYSSLYVKKIDSRVYIQPTPESSMTNKSGDQTSFKLTRIDVEKKHKWLPIH